jgi:hypothetical protein
MTRSIRRRGQYVLTQLIAASAVTLAGAQLAQAQQPPATQQNSTTTRAATKSDLKKLEQNGYKPDADDPHYPRNIQNAEKKAAGGTSTPAPAGQAPQ